MFYSFTLPLIILCLIAVVFGVVGILLLLSIIWDSWVVKERVQGYNFVRTYYHTGRVVIYWSVLLLLPVFAAGFINL